MKVRDIMSHSVETINPNAAITEAANKMKLFDVGVLPVVQEGRIKGVITDRDIVVRVIAGNLNPHRTPVSAATTDRAVCCNEDVDVAEAARIMEEKKVRRLLVLGQDNEITGILSIGDIAAKLNDVHLLHKVLHSVCEPVRVH